MFDASKDGLPELESTAFNSDFRKYFLHCFERRQLEVCQNVAHTADVAECRQEGRSQGCQHLNVSIGCLVGENGEY